MSVQVWMHCDAATMAPGAQQPYGLVENAALVVEGDTLAWVGPHAALPSQWMERCTVLNDAGGALITPGLIDCHTHLVYGGDRANEFEMRLNGASYEDISRAGGGIASTVKATRTATAAELQSSAARRLRKLVAEGVTTVEIKSGYGLALEHERKCLAVARALAQDHAVDVRTTFLAHTLFRTSLPVAPMNTSIPSCRCCPCCTPRAWWTQWTAFANALPSAPRRWSGCLRRPRPWAFR